MALLADLQLSAAIHSLGYVALHDVYAACKGNQSYATALPEIYTESWRGLLSGIDLISATFLLPGQCLAPQIMGYNLRSDLPSPSPDQQIAVLPSTRADIEMAGAIGEKLNYQTYCFPDTVRVVLPIYTELENTVQWALMWWDRGFDTHWRCSLYSPFGVLHSQLLSFAHATQTEHTHRFYTSEFSDLSVRSIPSDNYHDSGVFVLALARRLLSDTATPPDINLDYEREHGLSDLACAFSHHSSNPPAVVDSDSSFGLRLQSSINSRLTYLPGLQPALPPLEVDPSLNIVDDLAPPQGRITRPQDNFIHCPVEGLCDCHDCFLDDHQAYQHFMVAHAAIFYTLRYGVDTDAFPFQADKCPACHAGLPTAEAVRLHSAIACHAQHVAVPDDTSSENAYQTSPAHCPIPGCKLVLQDKKLLDEHLFVVHNTTTDEVCGKRWTGNPFAPATSLRQYRLLILLLRDSRSANLSRFKNISDQDLWYNFLVLVRQLADSIESSYLFNVPASGLWQLCAQSSFLAYFDNVGYPAVANRLRYWGVLQHTERLLDTMSSVPDDPDRSAIVINELDGLITYHADYRELCDRAAHPIHLFILTTRGYLELDDDTLSSRPGQSFRALSSSSSREKMLAPTIQSGVALRSSRTSLRMQSVHLTTTSMTSGRRRAA